MRNSPLNRLELHGLLRGKRLRKLSARLLDHSLVFAAVPLIVTTGSVCRAFAIFLSPA